MGKSAKFHKRLTKKEKQVRLAISNNHKNLTSESQLSSSTLSSQDSLNTLNNAKPSTTTKITKKQNKKKRTKPTIKKDLEGDGDGSKKGQVGEKKDVKDYVDIFTGKKLYKPLIGGRNEK